jgi:flagellar assembly protein FliH
MSAPAKFLFDLDFAAPATARNAPPTISADAHEAALAEAEARGYRNGMAAAEAHARGDNETRAAQAYERIAVALQSAIGQLAGVKDRVEADAVAVALAVGRKLAPALVAREPIAEIAALAGECFGEMLQAPHVVVRVNETLHAAVRDKLAEIARGRGFEGRLVVLGEAAIAPGDCRIEWADGGAVRDASAIDRTVESVVTRYLAHGRDDARPFQE